MKIELIYVLESAGEIKYKSGNAEDVIRKFKETYDELHEKAKAKAEGDYCNSFENSTNKYFLDGSISASIGNKSFNYKLRTEVRVLDERKSDLLAYSVLAKIAKDREAMEMLTCDDAREAIQKEIEELNGLLKEITSNK